MTVILFKSDYSIAGQFNVTGEEVENGVTSSDDDLYLTSPLFVSYSVRQGEEERVKELRT